MTTSVRNHWANPLDFLFSCLGYAVGLGNVWRFPVLCFIHGGGTFLVPYFLILIFAGFPIFFLEISLGQFAQVGPIKLFGQFARIGRGLGYAVLHVSLYLSFFYILLISWSIWYLFGSFSDPLEWTKCSHSYNTLECTEFKSSNKSKSFAVEEYWFNYVLGNPRLHTWTNYGLPRSQSVLCLFVSWLIVALCLNKGIRVSGKISYFTSLFPYLVLTSLAFRGISLPGSLDGIIYYLTPQWSHLVSGRIWIDAGTQVFFSLGPACGSLITLGSYNQKNRNVQKDAVLIVFLNTMTSIYSGLVVFSILGFMAKESGLELHEIVQGGPGLAFLVYPEVVSKMPGSQIWACLFFLMLISLALGSIFGAFETILTGITDTWIVLENYKSTLVYSLSLLMFLLGLSFTSGAGIHMFILFNSTAPSWNLLLLAFLEVTLISWVYGAKKYIHHLTFELNIKLSGFSKVYWRLCWSIVTPLLLMTLLLTFCYEFGQLGYEEYIYPTSIQILGHFITGSTCLWIPFFAIIESKNGVSLWKPKENCNSEPVNELTVVNV